MSDTFEWKEKGINFPAQFTAHIGTETVRFFAHEHAKIEYGENGAHYAPGHHAVVDVPLEALMELCTKLIIASMKAQDPSAIVPLAAIMSANGDNAGMSAIGDIPNGDRIPGHPHIEFENVETVRVGDVEHSERVTIYAPRLGDFDVVSEQPGMTTIPLVRDSDIMQPLGPHGDEDK